MTTQHTHGRVSVSKPRKAHRTNALMFGISGLETVDDWEDWGFNEADARRLVACWNACEGMSTSGIEVVARLGGIENKMRVTAGLVRQRDELLEVLEMIANMGLDARQCMEMARAAIQKAEGKS